MIEERRIHSVRKVTILLKNNINKDLTCIEMRKYDVQN